MDPISAIAMASSALGAIKSAINTGKEIHEVTGEIGKFFGAVTNARTAPKKKKSVFKKLLDKGSVEQEALETIVNQKKLEQMESELRELIVYTYGVETYRDMIILRRKIKLDRELEEKKELLRRKELFQNYIYAAVITGCVGVIAWITIVILQYM
jgi:hypothetical protein